MGRTRGPTPPGRPSAAAFARSVVHASGAPLLLLDGDLRVVAASAGYLGSFHDSAPEGKRLEEITGGAWTEARVQELLDHVRRGDPGGSIDTQVICLDGARQVRVRIESAAPDASALVISIEDRTDVVARDAERDAQLKETAALLHETQHRTANNLALISSILNMKAHAVVSEETRAELESARRRVLAMAAIERHLQYSDPHVSTPIGPFLEALCRQLKASLVGEGREIRLVVHADQGSQPRRVAVILGLAVTELIINALKYAFPNGRAGEIVVDYQETGSGWRASVADDGAGLRAAGPSAGDGMGSGIVAALAAQLKARVCVDDDAGVKVELICELADPGSSGS